MGVIVKNITISDRSHKSRGIRTQSTLDYICKGENREKVERVWYGNTFSESDSRMCDAEMVGLVESNPKARNPTRHLIVSWRNDEFLPDQKEINSAISITLQQMNLADCMFKAAVHCDTGNIHVHVIVVNMDTQTSRMRQTPMILDKCMKVIAIHNQLFGRPSHPGDRYQMVFGKPVVKSEVRADARVVEKTEHAIANSSQIEL